MDTIWIETFPVYGYLEGIDGLPAWTARFSRYQGRNVLESFTSSDSLSSEEIDCAIDQARAHINRWRPEEEE
jgi:hypothetical protein